MLPPESRVINVGVPEQNRTTTMLQCIITGITINTFQLAEYHQYWIMSRTIDTQFWISKHNNVIIKEQQWILRHQNNITVSIISHRIQIPTRMNKFIMHLYHFKCRPKCCLLHNRTNVNNNGQQQQWIPMNNKKQSSTIPNKQVI